MGIEVEFISKELIKPSSSTPHHLQKHKFSLIDQNQFPISIPFVLFYEKSTSISNQQRCNLLRSSLSKALTIFYPLAGRINNYSYTDCNDEGALFIQAKAKCTLSFILQDRNEYYNNSEMFFPLQPNKGVHQYGSLFQVTYFDCGGIAISFAIPHMLGDALSMFTFLKCWGEVARGSKPEIPLIVSDSLFPPKEIPGYDLNQWAFKENVITKSFVFDASALSALRDKYSGNGEKLSRMLALSVFILNRIIATTSRVTEDDNNNKNNRCMVIHAVNARPLLDPPIPIHSFGNLICATPVLVDNIDHNSKDFDYYEVGRKMKDAMKSVDAESIRKYQKGELTFDKETFMQCIRGEIARYSFSSLCNFPVNEADFGWGKPRWLAMSTMFLDNFVILTDTKEGQGIEAWIGMTKDDMTEFENDEQLVYYLSSNSNRESNLYSRL